MLGFGKKKSVSEDTALYAPLSGQVIDLEEVSDPVFAKKVMGDGYAIEPTNNVVVSPVAGEITLVQGHAIGFKRADGLEILLHLGIDTVSLNGQPFDIKAKIGDKVEGGDKLGSVDWKQVESAGLPLTSMVLITNTAEKLDKISVQKGSAQEGEKLGQASAK
ncbi:PTS sugar transporter subunit IIA [Lactococcus garvieae]|jgi:PTS system glucose-specific IIA component|uniref:PTS sugar transporter subunit IIA n=1 Tax=Lactococcus garvieae TaxID=1363 RepID=UPI0009BE884C|nr:PTS glucose transporter subunit IIA [Lactococcus garvieae]